MDPLVSESPSPPGRLLAAAVATAVLGSLPAMLIGGLAVLVRQDLGFDEAALGAAVSAFFAASIVLSVPAGFLSERTGPQVSMLAGSTTSVVSFVGIATLTPSWLALVGWLFVAGAGNTLAQVGVNHLLASRIPRGRQGLSFGVKQAAIPVSSMLAGLALPAVGLTIGWHWAFGLAALLVLPVVALVGRPAPYDRPASVARRAGDASLPALAVVALAAGLGSAAGSALVTFTVESAVAGGFEPSTAGLLLTVGSVCAITTRVVGGWIGDRLGTGSLLLATGLLIIGGTGYLGLAASWGDGPLVVIAALLAFVGGWGYQGLILLAISRTNRTSPATAMGIIRLGPSLGAMVGPLGIGALITAAGYPTAWLTTAVMAFSAASLMVAGRWLLRRGLRPVGALPRGSTS